MARSQAWKALEKQARDILIKNGLPSIRKVRGADWSVSDFDVEIEGHPEFKIDCKYSVKGFRNSRLLDIIEEKYCKEDGDIPILVTKGHRQRGAHVTLDFDYFTKILKAYLDGQEGTE